MKEKLTNNLVLKIASVLFAIAVWLIVLNVNDPDKTVSVSDIPVTILNGDAITSLGKAYSVKSGATCTIKISGPRSIVDMLDTEDFVATADAKELSLTNSIPIEVELKKNTYKSKVDISVETTLKLEVEDIIEKEYEIAVKYSGVTADNYVVTETSLENATVVITAPRSQIEKIKSVITTIDITGKTEDFDDITDIQLLDINNKPIDISKTEIKLSFNEVKSSSIVLFTKKLLVSCQLPEAIDYNTLISGYELSIEELKVIGRKQVLDTVTDIELPVNLDEYNDVEEAFSISYNIDGLLPEGVYNYTDAEEIVLRILVNNQANRTITTNAKNISISNIPDGFEASLVTKGEISYTIRGLKELVDEIDVEDIILKVDIGELDEGTHSLYVKFTLPDGITIVNDVLVEVNLARIEDETEEPTSENESTSENATSNDNIGETGSSEEETTKQEETTSPMENN